VNSSPTVSIVLPTLNGSRYIAASIESCLAQTYEYFELIVVDGGSTDGTLEIVRSFADPRIRIINQPGNLDQLPGALNCGFAAARGSLFTWTQDDDLYSPDALATMVHALESDPSLGFVYSGFWFIDADGEVLRAAVLGEPAELFRHNTVGHCFLYRREVADKVGKYDRAYLMAEDSHYWDRVFKVTRMQWLPGSYFYHRLHAGSLTVSDYGAYRAMRVAASARRQVLKIPWREYRRQVADAYIQEAFAAHANGAVARVRRCVAKGLLNDPLWIRNRGVVSIGLRALLGQRPHAVSH
jgi:glycosyltransferase involved in cell wall biosynthesis